MRAMATTCIGSSTMSVDLLHLKLRGKALETVAEDGMIFDLPPLDSAPSMKWFKIGDCRDNYGQLEFRGNSRTNINSAKRFAGARRSRNGCRKTQLSGSNNELHISSAGTISAAVSKPVDAVTRLLHELSVPLRKEVIPEQIEEKAQLRTMEPGITDHICLRYSEERHIKGDPSTPQVLRVRTGAFTNFSAHVDIMSEKYGPLSEHFKFMVDAALPAGLALNESTGQICGTALKAQDPTVRTVTINIDATGKGGVPLGLLPLASCTIIVNVVD